MTENSRPALGPGAVEYSLGLEANDTGDTRGALDYFRAAMTQQPGKASFAISAGISRALIPHHARSLALSDCALLHPRR